MKTEILDPLFDARKKLADIIVTISPDDPATKGQLLSLVARRDRITALINELIEIDVQKTTQEMLKAIDDLQAKTDELQKIADTIADVTQALGLADEVIKAAAALAAIIAAV